VNAMPAARALAVNPNRLPLWPRNCPIFLFFIPRPTYFQYQNESVHCADSPLKQALCVGTVLFYRWAQPPGHATLHGSGKRVE
jgi:hypothetical protein